MPPATWNGLYKGKDTVDREQYLETPLQQEDIKKLQPGDMVYLSGTIYTARDAAHERLIELLEQGKPLPFPLKNQVVYYAGPCPPKSDQVIGSVGPTTSGRMDRYSPTLMAKGLKFMIGKGSRSEEVQQAIRQHQGTYFLAIGGAAAYIARCVLEAEVIAFEDLGTEAIRRLKVKDFPLIVGINALGHGLP